jgi:hypothetical protein
MATVRDLSGNIPNSLNGTTGFKDRAAGLPDRVQRSYDANLSDSDELTNGVCQAVLVAAAGNVKVTYVNGTVDTVYLAAGGWHPMSVRQIWSTDTTATGVQVGY